MNAPAIKLRAAHRAIRIAGNGEPSIAGYRCQACGYANTDSTTCCRACTSREKPQEFTSSLTGKLYTWTVVERSYPGTKVPFVSAIVDMEDGLTLKGTLVINHPSALAQGLPVRLTFDDAGGLVGPDQDAYVGFHFIPQDEEVR